jgi:predicted NBD/HSP70 family sugar kinase
LLVHYTLNTLSEQVHLFTKCSIYMSGQLRKATHSQLRRTNRQLLLRAVYSGLSTSRAALAHETGLTKPTVSQLIQELIDQGYLVETGFGSSTEEGGKRPRILEYVPNARQVIGLSLTALRVTGVIGVLANLDGQVAAHHYVELADEPGRVFDAIVETINGLIAQLTAPLLCVCIGVPGAVDSALGVVRDVPTWGWHNFPLRDRLHDQFNSPVHVANSTELAAIGQYAFDSPADSSNLVTVLVEDSVGVGIVLDGAAYHAGGEISHLRLATGSTGNDGHPHHAKASETLGTHLSWARVRTRLESAIRDVYPGEKLMYLHLHQAVADGHPKALALEEELAGYLAPVFAWAITLLHPDHVSLVGPITDLGESFLRRVVSLAEQLAEPAVIRAVTVSLDSADDRAAVGAVAYALQQELGLI